MAYETEKLTLNIGVVELAQIDVLVEQGVYSNRSDCIRTALREHLKEHRERMELQLTPISRKERAIRAVGILTLSEKMLEKQAAENEKLSVNVIGMLIVEPGISRELFEKTVDHVNLRGKLVAPDEIKRLLK